MAGSNLAKQPIIIEAIRQEEIKLRVAAYCRVSTDSEDQLNSFVAQNTHYNAYIRNHENWTLVDVYADEGITGTSAKKRGDFQRLLNDCRKGKIDKVLVKSISRFARNTAECLETIRELKALGISVFFEEHNIDTKMIASEMMTAIIASCAQAESESISKNMRWSIKKRMENGTFNTCRPGMGFQLEDGKLVINEETAPVIQYIFQQYLNGVASRTIAEQLTESGVLGRVWRRNMIDYILQNERYAGNALLQQKYRTDTFPPVKKRNYGERPMYYVKGSNEAIVSKDMFDQAAELRASRQKEKRQEDVPVPFAKMIRCNCCGGLLRRKQTNGIWYWVCRTHESDKEACTMPPVPEEEIVNAFLRLYYKLKHQGNLIFKTIIRNSVKIRKGRMLWNKDVVELNKQISDIAEKIHNLTKLNENGFLHPDAYISRSNRLAEQLRAAKQKKEKLLEQEDDDLIVKTRWIMEALEQGPNFLDAFDGELFCELVERIIVESNTRIWFRLKNGLELTENIERTVR